MVKAVRSLLSPVLAIVLLMLFAVVTPAAAQSLEPPTVAAKALKRGRGVEVKVTLPRSLQKSKVRRKLSVVLERDMGAGFITYAQFSRPRRSFRYRDRAGTNGTYAYRAWVTGAAGQSSYSNVASVTSGTPPPPPVSGSNCDDLSLPSGISACPAGYEEQVLNSVNEQRANNGVSHLAPNRALNCSTRAHTIWMIQNNNFSHEGWVEFIRQAGYSGGMIGENIALGYPTPAAVMSGWMNSPGHRANILNGGYRDLGVSCLMRNGTPWWTQNFGAQ